jgi:phosphoribosylformylglycinamidine synthase
MSFTAAVITFPGSNCDRDMAVAIEEISGGTVHRVWHGDADLPEGLDFIALPGGFSMATICAPARWPPGRR